MKKVFYPLLFILISSLYFLYSCDSNPSESPAYPPGAITGRVLDSGTHKPLAGVFINTIPATVGCLTDTSGRYILAGISMPTSGKVVTITYTRVKYLSDTITIWMLADDTLEINDIQLIPTNGVYSRNNIQIQQSDYPESISNIDLDILCARTSLEWLRDIDLRDSMNAKLRFQFRSSDENPNQIGFATKFANSLGSFTKTEFDTLAKFYGAGEPLSEADFPYTKTNGYFYTPLTELSVYPFYLKGRNTLDPNLKIFGLLYIKSTWLEPGNNRFMVSVDVKINKNGQNYFIPNN